MWRCPAPTPASSATTRPPGGRCSSSPAAPAGSPRRTWSSPPRSSPAWCCSTCWASCRCRWACSATRAPPCSSDSTGSGRSRRRPGARPPPQGPRVPAPSDHTAAVPRPPAAPTPRPGWSPWRAVVGFGVVNLAADMVYEGARSVTGPLLASLGASALLVGVVTGAGEALALVLRLPFGTRADRSSGYWPMTIAGYGLTAVCVPLLAVTPFLGAAGLAVGCLLVLAERTGKAVRSPAKSTLLAHAAGPVGLGRGFGVHKALDQIGAFAGPLVVAGVIALTGVLWPAF